MRAPFPPNESQRLAALRDHGVLDSLSEPLFDDIARLAALSCQTPIALISLIDENRQWFKASIGVDVCETHRDVAFCAHAILDPTRPLIIPDATVDVRFKDNPLVTGPAQLRAYAGFPLTDAAGLPLGTLCVADRVARTFTPTQIETLAILARQVIANLELRRRTLELTEHKAAVDKCAIVAVMDTSGSFVDANDRFCALAEKSREDLLGADKTRFWDEDSLLSFFSNSWSLISREGSWRGEINFTSSEGRTTWLDAAVVSLRDGEGKPWRYLFIATDITRQKEIEIQLRSQERWQQELINALPAAVYTTDANGVITSFNRAAVEFAGRVPEIGTDSWCVSWKLFTADGIPLPHAECPMAIALKQGRPIRGVEAIAERPDGTRVNFEPYPTPLLDSSGKLLGAVNMLVDITERKRAEQKLRLLGNALEYAVESIVITDADLDSPGPRIVYTNPGFTRLTGYEAQEVLGKSPRISQGPKTDRAVTKRLRETLSAGGSFAGQTVNYRKDGSEYYLEWQIAPIRDSAGRVTHFVSVQRDITQRKQIEMDLAAAREQALEAVRLKTRFLANISHELRTPLNTINGLSATLIDQDLPSETKQAAELILKCGENLLQNIQTILTHATLEARETKLEFKPFQLSTVVLDALRITSEGAFGKGLALDYGVDVSTPAEIIGDSFRLQQVLVNLLANAIKFTDQGGVYLSIKCRRKGDHQHQLSMTVFDSGIGITRENQEKLFKPFSQADDSATRRFEGTGLGLVISRSLANLMGGDIHVKSKPGRGSAFRFSIVVSSSPNSPTWFANQPPQPLTGRRVLVVDPSRRRCDLLCSMARSLGMRAHAVAHSSWKTQGFDECIRFDYVLRTLPTGRDASIAGKPPIQGCENAPVVWMSPRGKRVPIPAGTRACLLTGPIHFSDLQAAFLAFSTSAAPEPSVAPSKRQAPLGERLPLRILAADDISTNREVLRRICKHLGYEPQIVENGAEVLEELQRQTYDVILMDLQMPIMDGMTASRELLQQYPDRSQRPKIIAITASALPGDRENCIAAGMDDYLSKPVLPKELQACLERNFLNRGALGHESPHAPAPVEPRSQFVDFAHLEKWVADPDDHGGLEALVQLAAMVKTDVTQLLPSITEAAEQKDATRLAECVHGLKGCVLTLGWTTLGATCASALLQLRQGTFEDWKTLPPKLIHLFHACVQETDTFLATRSSPQPSPAPVVS